eukprot:4479570-Heterocapsa_arctica.AAC.1
MARESAHAGSVLLGPPRGARRDRYGTQPAAAAHRHRGRPLHRWERERAGEDVARPGGEARMPRPSAATPQMQVLVAGPG